MARSGNDLTRSVMLSLTPDHFEPRTFLQPPSCNLCLRGCSLTFYLQSHTRQKKSDKTTANITTTNPTQPRPLIGHTIPPGASQSTYKMGDTDDKGHVEKGIRKVRQDLQAMRDLRELVKLKAQLAEEQNKLQEEQARLDKAQKGVGPDAFGSISRQPSMASDFSVALDDLIRPFRDSSIVIATPTDIDQFENNNIATSGPTPVTCKRVRSEASPPALQEPYTPATDPASYAPEPVQMNIGHIGQEPSAKRIRADEAAATLDLPRSSLRKLPLGEGEHKTGMRGFFSESGFGM
ncbi:hypothetical protein N7508_007417 [Penicillium antarcticum]|uniref:uncharacterized protein n=1 Tax=Penicillium antarcticum TaxID=416450 RepID=UPI0023857B86|nr:uncharacterized protein N7508_007417 [Penicillium antarcticum]KAJ5300174.1 hypothetical protein N7508_007417 [Penicillium antarcticum]